MNEINVLPKIVPNNIQHMSTISIVEGLKSGEISNEIVKGEILREVISYLRYEKGLPIYKIAHITGRHRDTIHNHLSKLEDINIRKLKNEGFDIYTYITRLIRSTEIAQNIALKKQDASSYIRAEHMLFDRLQSVGFLPKLADESVNDLNATVKMLKIMMAGFAELTPEEREDIANDDLELSGIVKNPSF